jgi:hypothetical protein
MGPPRPRCGCGRRFGSRIAPSRKELEVCSTRVFSPRPAIQFPGGDDNFLLGRDQIVDPALVAARHVAALALRQRELLLVGLHFEEEDVAARLVGPRAAREIARAHVVRDDVARLHRQIFEKQRVPSGDVDAGTRDRQRHDRLDILHRVDQVEAIDAVVVFGLRLDVDFLETGHRSIRGRLENAHVGRSILERANEVFRLARGADAVAISQ